MPGAARITDTVNGTTAGEHSGHAPPHPPEPFSGEISGACSQREREYHRRERDREDRRVSHGNRNTGAKNHF